MKIDCATLEPNEFPSKVTVRSHTFTTDVLESVGGHDQGPGPHDLFDASLAACKALTAMWYAKKNNIPLERVESHVESDNSEERTGKYRLKVHLEFIGEKLDDEMKKRLAAAAAKCPIHKLMTTTEVEVETV